MNSISNHGRHLAMQLRTKGVVCLEDLPIEIIFEIYHQLDINSIYRLSRVNRRLLDLFRQRKAMILIPVLERDFSPFDELLQIHTASAEDIDASDERYRPRTVVLRRFPGDKRYTLTPHSAPPGVAHQRTNDNDFTQVVRGRIHGQSAALTKTVILTEGDLDSILLRCRTVQQWEQRFPQMRWIHEPQNCRTLRSHESHRFRRALYRWWLYGVYFHGDLTRPHIGLPAPFVRDIRTSLMRYYSTTELLELMDLVETVKDIILHYICPRLDPNHHKLDDSVLPMDKLDRSKSLATSWTDQSCWGRIVKTYAKLGPEELIYYLDNICSYPRKRLLAELHLHHPNFTFDQESIQIAIRCALDEREWLDKSPSLAEDSVGGIIDFNDERDDERLDFGGDASPDGLPASGSKLGLSQSRYSPRGDDGSNLEDNLLYQMEMEERFGSTMTWLRGVGRL